ncbi:hypothetical protein GGR54DRAFT_652942 [Hypoxylon sp. NC1633]|nr:hypothetical protein GGR54DRAFT_652942 [Hypoxylon sp. NC1633]
MKLHRDQAHSQARKIGGWQREVINCQRSPQGGESSHQSYGASNGNQQSSHSRKRRRLSESKGRGSDGGDGEGDEREDGEGNGEPEDHDEGSISADAKGRYACPFNKSDSARFCVNATTGNQFRVWSTASTTSSEI